MAADVGTPGHWKDSIKKQLLTRNKVQTDAFASLILCHNRVFEAFDSIKAENIALNVANEKLRQDNVQVSGGDVGDVKANERIQGLERKLYKAQEELTELLKTKNDDAQAVIHLTSTVQERDAEIRRKDGTIEAQAAEIDRLKAQAESARSALAEIEAANALIQDEYNSLQMAFHRTELNLRKMQEENIELVERWMKSKAADADRLNLENEEVIKIKNEKLRRELEEAAKEVRVVINEDAFEGGKEPFSPLCFNCPVPARACESWEAHDGEVNALVWNLAGKTLVSGGGDKRIRMWNISRGGEHDARGMFTGNSASVMSLDFNAEESMLLAASNDCAARIWTPEDQRLRHTLTGHSNKVMAARFMGGGGGASLVVSGSHDRTLKIWDLRSRACSQTIFAGSVCNDVVACESLSTSIISGHFDKKVRFWDPRNCKTPASELTFQGKVTSVVLSKDLKYLLACVRDDSLKLMDLLLNQVVNTFNAEGFHVGVDWSRAALSPDSSLVAAGSSDGSVFVWNVATGRVEKVLKEHGCAVIACSWHPSGDFLATCDKNKKIVLWSSV